MSLKKRPNVSLNQPKTVADLLNKINARIDELEKSIQPPQSKTNLSYYWKKIIIRVTGKHEEINKQIRMLHACKTYLTLIDNLIPLKKVDEWSLPSVKQPENYFYKKPNFASLQQHLAITGAQHKSQAFWEKYKMNPHTKELVRDTLLLSDSQESFLPAKAKILEACKKRSL